MHKRLKILINNIKEVFSLKLLDKLSKKTKFVRRRSKITAETFLAFNTFLSEDICSKSLSTLSARLAAQYNLEISPQALNERFNEYSVQFMREVFNNMMLSQNKILSHPHRKLNFSRILVNDSTSYGLPSKFYNEFKGSGGSSSKAAIKIQLQYDLLSGSFLCCDTYNGTASDGKYVEVMDKYTEAGDLRLTDLGYYKLDYLKQIDAKGAFFISKLKSTTVIYKKNPNPQRNSKGEILKSTEYIKIDIFELIKPLADGQTIELKDIYIGSKKELKSRLIITKLSEENRKKRKNKLIKAVKRDCGNINDRSLAWNGVNVYITNVPENILATEEIHDVYSLRWQVEIMFKIWKSIFKINNVKPVKIERFKCFLYGRLIALILSSTIVFSARNIIYEEDNNEISELKSFCVVTEFFSTLKIEIFKGELAILKLIKTIINTIRKLGKKSRKKGRKIVTDILDYLKISVDDL